jgi:oligopeptide/dipeptide ABC transporter ATP-binding protein
VALLEVKDLRTYFFTRKGIVKAVDGVSFQVDRGKVLGIFGESGGGKSQTALSIMRLIAPPGRIVKGQVLFKGQDLTRLSKSAIRSIRGDEIAMIFQDPMTSLTPFFTIGNQLLEAIQQHRDVSLVEAKEIAIRMLKIANLPDPESQLGAYPFQLSGGMRQRVMIAIALSCSPDLLLADEPTTALDVTTQAQILLEMRELQQEFGMATIIITHDLGVIGELADEVIVMYGGRIVEYAPLDIIMHRPRHPYTRALIHSVPNLSTPIGPLDSIRGLPPDLLSLPSGCAFYPRCAYSQERCKKDRPELISLYPDHRVACHFVDHLPEVIQ